MSQQRNREEVVNTQLAVLISKLGVTADAETIHLHGTHRPEVLFQLRGLRAVIEGKFADVANAEQIVLGDARKRVRAGIAHIAAATVYPVALRTTPTTKILDTLSDTRLRYCIITETSDGNDWFEGNPASLMESLRRAREALSQDDIVERTAKALHGQLVGVAQLRLGQAGACDRLSNILGITPPKGETQEKAEGRRETAAKVSALVLANTLIFQEQLAMTDGRVSPLRKIEKEADFVGALATHWRWIWENINYVSIFQLGERVLKVLGNTWWAQNTKRLDIPRQKTLVLWLNSSLCVLAFFSRRVTTEGAFVQMKQPAWESMPVLDVRSLTQDQLTSLANAYDEAASQSFAPLAQSDADPARISIDDALCTVLGLPSLAPVRALLAREPGLTGRSIGERQLTG